MGGHSKLNDPHPVTVASVNVNHDSMFISKKQ